MSPTMSYIRGWGWGPGLYMCCPVMVDMKLWFMNVSFLNTIRRDGQLVFAEHLCLLYDIKITTTLLVVIDLNIKVHAV